jgi:hypothetical protein
VVEVRVRIGNQRLIGEVVDGVEVGCHLGDSFRCRHVDLDDGT